MRGQEEFADPTVVPGPNVRSLFTDTEQIDGAVTEQVDVDASRFCSACHRVLSSTELVCPADGAALMAPRWSRYRRHLATDPAPPRARRDADA